MTNSIRFLVMQPDASAECLVQLLRQLRVPVTRRSVYEELSRHPDHPSLLAFSDVLTAWGVPNAAYRVSEAELAAVPTPFVAHLATQGGEFRLIEQVGPERVAGTRLGTRPTSFSTQEFKRAFTGSVLLAEARPEAGELQYRQRHRQERARALRLPVVGAGCLLLALLVLGRSGFLQVADWHLTLLLAAKSTGLVAAGLLLAQSLGHQNPLLQRLCGSNPAAGCQAILASSAAHLTPEISWAEVGFGYFAGTWLALLLLAASPGSRLVLTGLSLLSLPFTAYSLYYQARVARQWCPICCTVLAVLWVEAAACTTFLTPPFMLPSLAEWATLLGCLLAPVLAWAFVKPYLTQARQTETLGQQLAAFKRHRGLFASSLAAQPRHELLPPTDTIRLGNPVARQVLTVVTSPTCPPCVDTHETLKRWLTQRDDLQVQFVFAVPDHPHDLRTQVAAHLLALHQQDPSTVDAALHDWYANQQQGYAFWASRYPTPTEAVAATSLARHRAWCRQAGVTGTPTILLNGQELPDLYRLEDIQYLL